MDEINSVSGGNKKVLKKRRRKVKKAE